MASVPPGGAIAAVGRLGARHPLLLLQTSLRLSLRPFIDTSALVRELFFTAATPQEVVDACRVRMQDESYLALIDMVVFVLPRPRRIRVPVLVLGAEQDAFFTVREVRRTARAYRTEAEIFPGMGHNMTLDEGWHMVVDRIDDWVRRIPQPG